jgi:hypothetical protein
MKYRRTTDWKYELQKECSFPLLPCMKESGTIEGYVKVKDGCITIQKGYRWNGADWFPDLECTQEATLVHDALYQLMSAGKIDPRHRKCADRQLYCMVKAGCSRWLASTMYNAVRAYQVAGGSIRLPAGVAGGLWGASKGLVAPEGFSCGFQEGACPDAPQMAAAVERSPIREARQESG